ncbi:hypothetical protein FRC10_006902, partial [Ceratobasidium sp. 414]
MSRNKRKVTNTATSPSKAIIMWDFDEDDQPVKKKSKPHASSGLAVNLLIDPDHRFNWDASQEAVQLDFVPPEPEFHGLDLDLDEFGLADE